MKTRNPALIREPRLCARDGCGVMIENPSFNQRWCSAECHVETPKYPIAREPMQCEGEGCSVIIEYPRQYQRWCTPDHALPLAVRQRREQNKEDEIAKDWADSREATEVLRQRLLPCVTCGHSPQVEVLLETHHSFARITVTCCVELFTESGLEAAVSLWNRTPLISEPSPRTN